MTEPVLLDTIQLLVPYQFDQLVQITNGALSLLATDPFIPYDRRLLELCKIEDRIHQVRWHLSHREEEARRNPYGHGPVTPG